MNAPQLLLTFDGERRQFAPGETLSGKYLIDGLDLADVQAIELSILWYTEGKGDEDLAVHHFERIESTGKPSAELRPANVFSTRLPPSPLSYAGVIVKIHWCARLRVFLSDGKHLLAEVPFQLGRVPTAHEVDV